jgi:hypothetical protein
MSDNQGASVPDQALVSDQAAARLDPSGFDPSRERDPYWEYEENDCGNCGGEGLTYGCSWDWQCDTYDEGEGTCLCTRRCEWCQPRKHDPALQAVLAEALAAGGGK